jgi:hypothetical protein
MIELIDINEKYLKSFPGAETLFNFTTSFSIEALINIYNESKGREIIFTKLKGLDHYKYSFK